MDSLFIERFEMPDFVLTRHTLAFLSLPNMTSTILPSSQVAVFSEINTLFCLGLTF